jgi:hypothetical protein
LAKYFSVFESIFRRAKNKHEKIVRLVVVCGYTLKQGLIQCEAIKR